jgi:hypothetical protein
MHQLARDLYMYSVSRAEEIGCGRAAGRQRVGVVIELQKTACGTHLCERAARVVKLTNLLREAQALLQPAWPESAAEAPMKKSLDERTRERTPLTI